MSNVRLTQYSSAAGCGCKIAPNVLEEILKTKHTNDFKNLLVGNESADDAAVYNIGNNQAIISTTDFFMPIVDDAFDFGRVAAANALSDVYAMGGKPLMAVAILGWPVEKLPPELAQQVLEGAREVCKQANIPLAGGHSIISPEPLFGLAVTGLVDSRNIKKNNTAKVGDLLFLTKPIGTGIMSTAQKRGLLKEEDYKVLVSQMCELNRVGEELGKMEGVHALTDVTGFGLAGHLIEMCDGSGLSAQLKLNGWPLIKGLEEYVAKFVFPDNTTRNFNTYKNKVLGMDGMEFATLCDPQTSGGLLISIAPDSVDEYFKLAKQFNLSECAYTPIGSIVERLDQAIVLK